MGPGIMSLRTIDLINQIRKKGCLFVYITGARYSTLLERLPLMAVVDASFAESGGRFLFNECTETDSSWAQRMEPTCGSSMYHNLEPLQRPGILWDWARLLSSMGYELDTRSYFYGFRIDLLKQKTEDLRNLYIFNELVKSSLDPQLMSASNLGKIDFFPALSGKGNAVSYFLERNDLRKEDAVSIFDDENDLPMAYAVETCYVVQATHTAITDALRRNPSWNVANGTAVLATEEVLSTILKQF